MKHLKHNYRAAFSLIEILVVLGIAALVGSLVMGGFFSFQGSQRRSTCQGNLVQIYRACRLYANDNITFPLTYPVPGAAAGSTPLSGGLGLLWARSDMTAGGTGLGAPNEYVSYLKRPDALHCPADIKGSTSPINANEYVELSFLSYQKPDPLDITQETYSPIRTRAFGGTNADPDYARQLIHTRPLPDGGLVRVPIPSNTVVTWCPWHRGVGSKPDNVLFFDGSVKRMQIQQEKSCLSGRTANDPELTGWRRVADCSSASQNSSASQSGEGTALAK